MNIDNALKIDGWMSENELRFLAQQAEAAELIVEIGCWKGRSTRALADNTKGQILAVDPWNGDYPDNNGGIHGIRTDVFHYFKANLLDKINDGTVVPFMMKSDAFYTSRSPNFVFIDGDHQYPVVIADINLGLSILRKGGILAGHDYSHTDWPGVKQAVDEMFPKINVIDSIWWVYVQGSNSNSDNGICTSS
jgi:SAM-dependent methyltransferase